MHSRLSPSTLSIARATLKVANRRSRPCVAVEQLEDRLSPATLYWDANGASAGTGGTGNWDATSAVWRLGTNAGPLQAWVDGSDAIFEGTAGTVSIASSGVTAASVSFQTTAYIVQNNVLTLSGAATIANAAATVTIHSKISGTQGLTKLGTGALALSSVSSDYTGATKIFAGSIRLTTAVNLQANGPLGSSAGGAVILGDSQTAANAELITTAAFDRDIDVQTGAGTRSIGAWTDSIVTYSGAIGLGKTTLFKGFDSTGNLSGTVALAGVISGAGGITVSSGFIRLLNGANSYTGVTTILNGGLGIYAHVPATGLSVLGNASSGDIVVGGDSNAAFFSIFSVGQSAATFSRNITIAGGGGSRLLMMGLPQPTQVEGAIKLIGDVSISGLGSIDGLVSGPGSIAVTNGTLTLGNAGNSFSGSLTLGSSATVSIASDGALGAIPATPTPGRLVLAGGLLIAVDSFTIHSNRGIALGPSSGSGTGSIAVGSFRTLVYGGIIANNGTGVGSLRMQSASPGTLVLSGQSTYTGTTTVDLSSVIRVDAAVTANGPGPLGNASSAVTIASSSSGIYLGVAGLTFGRPISLAAGTLGNSLPRGIGLAAGVLSGTFSGNISMDAAGSKTITVTPGGTLTISGVISGNPGTGATDSNLNFTGAGTIIVTGANTFVGPVNIGNGAILSVSSLGDYSASPTPSNLGAPTSSVTGQINFFNSNGGGTLLYTGPGVTTNRPIGFVTSSASNSLISGVINNAGAGALNFSATVFGVGTTTNVRDITFTGAAGGTIQGIIERATTVRTTGGSWTLSGVNTHTGATQIAAGVLKFNGPNDVIPNTGGTVLTVAGGTLDLADRNETAASVVLTSGSILGTTGVLSSAAAIDARNGSIGALLGGALTKSTAGTVVLNGPTNYGGATTVSGGVLVVASGANVVSTASVAISGSSSLIVNGQLRPTAAGISFPSGSTLGGTGILTANPTIASGGTLAPGPTADATGILTIVGNLALAGRYYAEINGGASPIAGTDYDQTNVTGTVNLTGSRLVLAGTRSDDAPGAVIVLIKNDAAEAVTGEFANLPESATVALNGRLYSISYVYNAEAGVAGGGNDVALTSISSIDYYWDADGDSTPATGGAGTWNVGAMAWRAGSSSGTLVTWAQAQADSLGRARAIFQGAVGAIAVGSVTVQSLTFANSGTTLTGDFSANALPGSIEVAEGFVATVNATISGSAGLAKLGAGTLVLGGANTYNGTTIVVAGTLKISADNNLGAAPASATPGSLIIKDGILATTATFTLAANRGLSFEPTVPSGSVVIDVLTGTTLTYAGIAANFVPGSSGGLTKTGAGTLALSGTASTYYGATIITAGKLTISGDGSLGVVPGTPSPGSLSINSGATLEYTGNSATLNSNRGLALGPTSGTGSATISIANNTLSYGGIIANNGGGIGNLIKTGTGIFAITGINTYSGSTSILGGTLSVSADANLGSVPASGTPNKIVIDGGIFSAAESFTLNSNRGIALGPQTGTGSGTISVNTSSNGLPATFIYGGIIANNGVGTGELIKTGLVGTLELSGASTYTGTTTVSAGYIQVDASVTAGANGPLGNATSAITFGTTSATGFVIGVQNGTVARSMSIPNTNNSAATKLFSFARGITAGSYTGNMAFGGGLGLVTFDADGGTLSLAGVLSDGGGGGGGGGFAIVDGVFTVSNSANAFSGAVIVGTDSSKTTLKVTANNALGSATTSPGVRLGAFGILLFSGGVQYTPNESVEFSTQLGRIEGEAGNNRFNGPVVLLSSGTFAANTPGNTLTLGGSISVPLGGVVKFQGIGDIVQESTSVISGAGGLSKTYDGADPYAIAGTLTLKGQNTYTGRTNVTAGTLSAASFNSVGSSTSSNLGKPATAADGVIGIGGRSENGSISVTGTLRYTGTGETTNRAIMLNPSATSGGNAIIEHAGTGLLKITGDISAHASARTLTLQGSTAGVAEFSGAIPNAPGPNVVTLIKAGSGTWTLSGANSYTGNTTISGGTLQFAKQVSFYNNTPANWTTAKIPIVLGAILALNVGGAGEFTAADIDIIKAIPYTGGSALGFDTTNAGGAFAYDGSLTNANSGNNFIGLSKFGANALSLGGANTYTGPTSIFAGAIAINGSLSPSSTLFALNSGQTLAGSGQINRSVAINPGATLAPGNSIGTLSVNNNLALAGVSSFEVTAGSGPLGSADKAANIAALTYGGTLKIIKLGGTLTAGDSWDLFDFASQSGTFANNAVFETAGDGVNLPVLGTKLIWQFNYATGVLAVVSLTPTVTSITPAIGPTTGGVLVTIIGSSFISISSVTFDGVAAATFSVTGTTQINAIAPPKSGMLPGTVDVVVGNYAATGSLVGSSDFTYATPAVASVVVNGGPDVIVAGATVSLAGQHSVVKQIRVEFNQAVTVAPDAFTVTPRASNVIVNGGAAPSTLAVTTSVTPLSPSEYLVTFSGPGTHSGVINSGIYDLTTVAGKVASNGDAMAANQMTTFFALFGNIEANNRYNGASITQPIPQAGYSSGDGLTKAFVDPGSLFRFSDTFGSSATNPVGPPAYNIVFDSNLDGSIDPGDLFAFSDSFGMDWTF